MIYKIFILQEKYFLFAMISFVLFWLRAVTCEITLYNIGRLLVGLAINIPFFFLVSPSLRVQLRKIFGGKYKYLKLCLYILVIQLIYSAFIAEHVYSNHSYFTILLVLTTFHLWQPLFILIFGYFLIDRFNESELTIKVIIFILGIFFFIIASNILITKNFLMIRYKIYDFSLLKVYFSYNEIDTFDLYRFWGLCLTVLVIALSDITYSPFSLDKKWNKKSIILTSIFLGYILFSCTWNIDIKYQQSEMQRLGWNLLSAIYPAIEISFFEEILFRSILQTYFCKKLYSVKDGYMLAIIICSLLFGVFHFPFTSKSLSPYFLHGLIFGWLYYKTQNIWTSILVHGFNNFLVLAILK